MSEPMTASRPITLTIVCDNYSLDARLTSAWGFASLIQAGETTILFDTGGDEQVLMHNLVALGFDLRRIDTVVLSHPHLDHIGGLNALMNHNDHLTVYMPRSCPGDLQARVGQHARVILVDGPVALTDRIHTTGELGTSIMEQSLLVETPNGLMVMTGCTHPGIVELVQQTKRYSTVSILVGGLHLFDKSEQAVEAIIAELKHLGVRKIAPCHCTGDQAIEQIKAAFGAGFVQAGVGAVISAEP